MTGDPFVSAATEAVDAIARQVDTELANDDQVLLVDCGQDPPTILEVESVRRGMDLADEGYTLELEAGTARWRSAGSGCWRLRFDGRPESWVLVGRRRRPQMQAAIAEAEARHAVEVLS